MTVPELLEALPKTSFEISEKFLREGIKGSKGCAGRCPITNYFKLFNIGVVTGLDYVVTTVGDELIRLPEGVRDFLRHFDNGDYPELERV